MPSGEAFGRHFPTWVPDQPGVGRSKAPAPARGVDGLAGFAATFMDAVGPERGAPVGTSFQ